MDNTKYNEFIKKYIPKEDKMKNEFIAFFFGGLLGLLSEILLELYQIWLNLPRKESGILVTLTLIVVASILTALGVFDVAVSKLKSALKRKL